jgi:hypothetical protein
MTVGICAEAVCTEEMSQYYWVYLFLLCTHSAIPVKDRSMLLNLLVKSCFLAVTCDR